MNGNTIFDSSSEDEEIWIGPVTSGREYVTRCLKANVFGTLHSSDRRNTFAGFTLSKRGSADSPNPHEAPSDYYTPETTMSQANVSFIDKVAEILNEPESTNTTFATAFDNSMHSDFMSIAKKVQPSCLLDNIEASLVNTMVVPDEMASESLIVISDDETDNDFLRYQGTQIKYEDITIEDVRDHDVEEDGNKAANAIEISDSDESCDSLNRSTVFDDTLEDMNRFLKYGSDYSVPDSTPKISMETNSIENSMALLQSLQSSATSSVQSSRSDDCFKIPESKPSAIPRKRIFVTPTKSRDVLKPKNCYDNIISPVSNYINHKSPAGTGSIPRRKFFRTPEPRTPMSKSNDKYKSIVSPVGVYIKHSGTVPIQRNVLSRPLPYHFLVVDEPSVELLDEIKERIAFRLPDVVYKKSTISRESKAAEIKIPDNIQVLLPSVVSEMCLVRHERRVNRRGDNAASMAHKLQNDQDLTVNFSLIELGKEDISILHKKQYL